MRENRSWKEHSGPILDSVQGFDVIDCARCGFKHIVPIPSEEELEKLYRSEYYSVEKPLYIERFEEDLPWWTQVYSEWFDTYEELVAGDQRKILDVGCGPGYFLAYARQRGWHGKGIEPSSRAAANCRKLGLDVDEDFLCEKNAHRFGNFDVIHLTEVLEHIPDPASLMDITRKMLNPGGLLCVMVPNDYSPVQHALRSVLGFKPWWVCPPHHINYFDFESLAHLANRRGYEVVSKEATFPIDMFLLMGDNYVGNDCLGRHCHSKRKTFELNLAKAGLTNLKRKIYRGFADSGFGRDVHLIARKLD